MEKRTKKATKQLLSNAELFDWLKQSIEINDAGFFYAIETKGEAAYKKHCKFYRAKAEFAVSINEAILIYQEWLKFFRNNHIGVQLNLPEAQRPGNSIPPIEVSDWATFNYSEAQLRDELAKQDVAGFEGIWSSDPYTIGIKKYGEEYIGFIISAPDTPWKEQQIKLRLVPTDDQGNYKAICYLRDYSPYEVKEAKLMGNNLIFLGFMSYTRVFPSFPDDADALLYTELMETRKALIKELSPDTLLLRLPSFDSSFQSEVESLLEAHHDRIIKAKNLIIDVRNNGGGSTECFRKITPYLYTNPIQYIGWEFRSSLLSLKKFKEWGMFDSDEDTPESRKQAKALLTKAKNNLGKLVKFDTADFVSTKLDEVLECPKQVAIIMNEKCASATESFLIHAKQSKKTKLYGRTSKGCFDISNMNNIVSPCKRIILRYAMTITKGFPDAAIDDIGIRPDFYLTRSLPEHKWIAYVRSILDAE
ncbi:MAG: S41 family peptidase [Candidatus Cloacimonetes bacterium]|nr:S41 family peptidase [Candidatus Cloacimonadota bacterium]